MAEVARAEGSRQRVSAAERRDALIDAAIEEFAVSGLHGTPVERIARRVGVTQPYVFSLFATKRDLFVAAMERCFETVGEHFEQAAAEALEPRATAEAGGGSATSRSGSGSPAGEIDCVENIVLDAIGTRYIELLTSDRKMLMAQLQAYAACEDDVIREHVQRRYRELFERIKELAGISDAQTDEFMSMGAYLTIQAAMGGTDLVALKAAHKDVLEDRRSGAGGAGSGLNEVAAQGPDGAAAQA